MKNLVMGTASGFDWSTLEPFVTSFVRYAKNTELVLFLRNISDFTLDRIIRVGNGLIKIEPLEYTDITLLGIQRFKNFKRYVDAHGNEYDKIFITDTRDVIFQSDVFEEFKGYTNFLGYMTEYDDIGDSRSGVSLNYKWIHNCFGKEAADKLKDKKIICAGSALIGTPREIKIFLDKLLSDDFCVERIAFDQAAFNYLIYNNLIPIKNLIEIDTYSGAVYTNCLVPDNKIRDDKILRGDGGVPAVVHQYDRHVNLLMLVDKIYRDKNFQVDSRFNDVRSTFEQAACLLSADKVEEAAQLFIGKLFVAKDFSNCNGALLRLWENAMCKPLTKASGDIELAVQAVLKTFNQFPYEILEKICLYLNFAHRGNRPVDTEFKNDVTRSLIYLANQTLAANELDKYRSCVELLKILGGKRR